jgi:hypothetical protein
MGKEKDRKCGGLTVVLVVVVVVVCSDAVSICLGERGHRFPCRDVSY